MGTTLEPKKLRKTFVNIISQNVRGFSDEKEEEIIELVLLENCLLAGLSIPDR